MIQREHDMAILMADLSGYTALLDALKDKEKFQFQRRGEFKFKNVSKPVEIFELVPAEFGQHLAVDPVCHMQIPRETSEISYTDGGHTFYFCTVECLDVFKESVSNAAPLLA